MEELKISNNFNRLGGFFNELVAKNSLRLASEGGGERFSGFKSKFLY